MEQQPNTQFPVTIDILRQLGYDYDDDALHEIADAANEELEARVADEITALMTTEQLEQLSELSQADPNDETSINDFILQCVPDKDQVVQDELDILIGELAENT